MEKVINYAKEAHEVMCNYFFTENAAKKFYEDALIACGECPIVSEGKKGLTLITTYLPKGKKGIEEVKLHAVTYDAARYENCEIQFHIADGADFFDKGEWVAAWKLDTFGDISYCIMHHIEFPKPKACVEVMSSTTNH